MPSKTTPECNTQNNGWLKLPGIKHRPSANFDARPDGTDVSLLVIHNISLPPGEFGTDCPAKLFLNELDFDAHPWFDQIRGLRVSSHFLIERDGTVTQFVSCNHRAWHAGVSTFNQRSVCNDFSIGIELEGTDNMPYTEPQYEALGKLTHALKTKYPLQHARGHCHIAPERKTDPGPAFDWARYAKLGNWRIDQLPSETNDE
ncbi:MAG: 1,6-anhydro-N-acetylmuramyl-L-alanine amidase AmpD [Burkholderiaceae bacterium]|nr:1,6-anhydro-N-acetylmuramyl-L-alanine amidase AmpD [Burkholderiaceae bacterium]